MADRVIRWHIAGVLSETGVVDTDVHGDAYRMDKDYHPIEAWIRVKTASQGVEGTGITVDINDDGVSIFAEGQEPTLPDNTTEDTCVNFTSLAMVIAKDSVVTLDVDSVGIEYPGKDLIVELTLEEAD